MKKRLRKKRATREATWGYYYYRQKNRKVLPIGSTSQHDLLSSLMDGGGLADLELFSQELSKNRRVAFTVVGGYNVSTVFLGLNHRYFGKGPPLVYETMVFANVRVVGGQSSDNIWSGPWRWPTWKIARRMHEEVVKALQYDLKKQRRQQREKAAAQEGSEETPAFTVIKGGRAADKGREGDAELPVDQGADLSDRVLSGTEPLPATAPETRSNPEGPSALSAGTEADGEGAEKAASNGDANE